MCPKDNWGVRRTNPLHEPLMMPQHGSGRIARCLSGCCAGIDHEPRQGRTSRNQPSSTPTVVSGLDVRPSACVAGRGAARPASSSTFRSSDFTTLPAVEVSA